MPIRFTSFLGDNALEFYRDIVCYLAGMTGLETDFVTNRSTGEREAMVKQQEIQVVFTCGLPYTFKADIVPPQLRVMAAPVMAAARYQDQAVYFSDVIVRSESPYDSFADLSGKSFAFNETRSFSGYVAVCRHLLQMGQTESFFGEWLKSGAHAMSMDWVEQARVEAAAIDSVVLEMELDQHPERSGRFRVVERIGPYPMPPVAAVSGLPEPIYQKLKTALLAMHHTERGQKILQQAQVQRFRGMTDRDYDPIRRVVQDLELTGRSVRL